MANEVPQWVTQAFVRSAQSAGATVSKDDILASCRSLLDVWSEDGRLHHDLRHLIEMLTRVDTLAPETQNPDLVRLAVWFHGIAFSTSDQAVYTRNGGEDEVASADIAAVELGKLGLPAAATAKVARLIKGLKTKGTPADGPADESMVFECVDMDQMVLCDAHLGILAVEPQRYKRYTEEVRAEYPHISDLHFYLARRQIVSKLLKRRKLFLTPLAQVWETQARQNLTAESERLAARLEAIEGSAAPANTPVEATGVAAATGEEVAVPAAAADAQELLSAEDFEDTQSTAELLALSEDEPEEIDVVEDETTFAPVPKQELLSSLETLDASFDPGAPPRELSGAEAEAARRDEIAQETVEIIQSRSREAEKREAEKRKAAEAAELEPAPVEVISPEKKAAISAPTPEWLDDEESLSESNSMETAFRVEVDPTEKAVLPKLTDSTSVKRIGSAASPEHGMERTPEF